MNNTIKHTFRLKSNPNIIALDLRALKLPADVLFESGEFIEINAEPSGWTSEIVVISQLKRKVYNAHICHIENDGKVHDCPFIDYPFEVGAHHLCVVDGIKYTMVCLAQKEKSAIHPTNWLY